MISNGAPVPIGRSMQIGVDARKSTVEAEVVRERLLDDLLLHLAVERDEELVPDIVLAEVDQRVLLGELMRARRAARPGRRVRAGTITVSSVGGAK